MKNLITIFEETLDKPDFEPKAKPEGEAKAPSFKIKPSMLGTPCERKLYYSCAGVKEDYGFDISGKKRMKLGDAIHEMLHSVYKKAGILIEYYNPDGSVNKDWKDPSKDDLEFPLACPELFIKKGKIDAVLKMEDGLWLGEYKSINMNGFGSLMGPKPDHLIQAVTYWYVFNLLLSEGRFKHIKELEGIERAKGVRWLYVNKDDTSMKEYTMTEGDATFESIVNKIMSVKDRYDKKVLPPKTPDFCRTCNWRTKCKDNFNI